MSQAIPLLKKLVAIDSTYPKEAELGQFLADYLVKKGFQVKKQPISKSRFNILASRGIGQSAICFYGHMDTVPSEDSNWQTLPMELTKESNKLIGRGAYDMKGGIAAFLTALEGHKGYLKIFLAVDEENISEGAWKAVKEKSDFFQDIELVISAEPNFDTGLHRITRGRTGRVIFEINFKGKAVHVAKYREGIDAVELMSQFINRFYLKRDTLFDSSDTVAMVGKVETITQGMSVCGEARLEVQVLMHGDDNISGILEKIQSLTQAKVSIKPRKTPYLENYFIANFPYQNKIAEIIKTKLGRKMELITSISVADDNVLASIGLPVISWGPDGGGAHTVNEWVDSKSLETLSKLYKEFLNSVYR